METHKYAVEEFSNLGFTKKSSIELQIELGVSDLVFEKNNFVYFSKTITCDLEEKKILNCLKAHGILWDMYKLSANGSGEVFNSTSCTIESLDELSSWIMKQILFDLFKKPTEQLYFIIKEKNGDIDAIIKRTFVTQLKN